MHFFNSYILTFHIVLIAKLFINLLNFQSMHFIILVLVSQICNLRLKACRRVYQPPGGKIQGVTYTPLGDTPLVDT